ncbi:uncharacterized protein N7477_009183 [Penicillium maclennaniae]|uniref:uncharacterized protein n=1 Tax=Penicillium maclennaniae TaxID=1343394 RepID=UPI00254083A4|nr:uncharacterized protein N7477_009183 [Penicillium maclennaniae]KAJ5661567.1 hypothetical protein N7477_009183 [Penicillium maclennaniae]
MSNPAERPWTEEERYALLTEILKKAGISSGHLFRLINEFRVSPNWHDIPLPQGRSLNSCKLAFYTMQQAPIQRPELIGTSTPIDPTLRKRPLYPAEKPIAPRAIQPRPPASTASHSSESSAQLSPRFDISTGEPPRKRGRPSKAETERRKAAAEARGEPYPPPRRSGSERLKIASPSSPAAPYPGPPPPGYGVPSRPIAPVPERDISTRMGMRELPEPQEMGPLPSPHALQLGPPDSFPPRLNSTSERGSFSAIPSDRFSPDSRRDSLTSRGEPPYEGRSSTTPGDPPR